MTIKNMYISKNRPYELRDKTTKIAVHYIGNPGTSAINNRNYFNNTYCGVSSNYIVGLEGEVICCIPPDEVSWCTCEANSYSPSIETCHPDSTGKFNDKTYKSLVELTAYLCKKYNLTEKDIIRHYDVTGKVCPRSFVPSKNGGTDNNSNSAWNKFKNDVKAVLEGKTISNKTPSTKTTIYRVRKSWTDSKSQIGAYSNLNNAKKACTSGYSVFDENGKVIYSLSKSTSTSSTSSATPSITYCVYNYSKWLPSVKNYNNSNDDGYAGIQKQVITGFAAKSSKGTLKYRVHIKGGSWLDWVSKYDINNWDDGCAGIKGKQIDAIQMKLEGVSGYEVKYRVSGISSSSYYPWVKGTEDYAGVFGDAIDCIQAEIVKK